LVFVVSLLRSHLRKPWAWAAGLLAAGWLFGLVSFVAADGHFASSMPRRRPDPDGLHNLVLWELGPTVRASSFFGDWLNHHHPFFLVDGRMHPDVVEKWASAERDPRPWLEILWREERTLERVVIRHAGSVESEAFTARRYRVTCLKAAGHGPALDIEDNEAPVATHDLACPQARGVRIDFHRNGGDIVRVFEVEAWGR
jgi:hypothetical protein